MHTNKLTLLSASSSRSAASSEVSLALFRVVRVIVRWGGADMVSGVDEVVEVEAEVP